MMNKNVILLKNGFIPRFNIENKTEGFADKNSLATVLTNLAYFNYVPSKKVMEVLLSMSEEELMLFWEKMHDSLNVLFHNFQNAEDGVVYKNFPEEVLNKTEGEYWFAQILMYLGMSVDFFVEEKYLRSPVSNVVVKAKVLQFEEENTLNEIFKSYLNKKSKFTPEEENIVSSLVVFFNLKHYNISEAPFKMNGVYVGNKVNEMGGTVEVENLTDLFRFAAFLSGETDLNKKIGFFKFSRKQRKQILRMFLTLNLNNFDSDVAQRKESFKALFKALRAGDYKWAYNVSELYNRLYNKQVRSVNSLAFADGFNFDVLIKHKGIFMRNFHYIYKNKPEEATRAMIETLPEFNVLQLLKFKRYLRFNHKIKDFIAKPNSSFANAKCIKNNKVVFEKEHLVSLLRNIEVVLTGKLSKAFPNGIMKGEDLGKIKLRSNDQEIDIGRGTRIKLPEGTNFIRSATMWKNKSLGSIWFDNGWNFIYKDMNRTASVCWTAIKEDFACFSGDPVTGFGGNEVGTQLIDINIQELKNSGVKYAVWNILCYSNISFNEAECVYACAQYMSDQNKGELFEPKNLDLQLEVKGKGNNKFVLVLDVEKDEVIILDQEFPKIKVQSAERNESIVAEFLPTLLDNLMLIPSVKDLVDNVKDGETPFLFSDSNVEIEGGEAYVFKQENENNHFSKIDLDYILGL